MFKSAFIVYLSSRESCWYFNDVFLSVVGEEYSKYRNSPFLEQHRCTYFLNAGRLTIASTMTTRPDTQSASLNPRSRLRARLGLQVKRMLGRRGEFRRASDNLLGIYVIQ